MFASLPSSCRGSLLRHARPRGRPAGPVTDDPQALNERLEAGTGEHVSALEGIGESVRPEHLRGHEHDGRESPDTEPPSPEAHRIALAGQNNRVTRTLPA